MISEELLTQVQRYQRSRSFALNEMMKEELAVWYKLQKQATLNKKCGTCIRNAMNDLVKWYQEDKAQEVKPAKIQFIGVKQERPLDKMSYNDLKALAQERGLKMGQAPKKAELIKALS